MIKIVRITATKPPFATGGIVRGELMLTTAVCRAPFNLQASTIEPFLLKTSTRKPFNFKVRVKNE
tara:strand:+ start:147 stop:341 length:195 start_codon:yes stop_codon:yes gene_type:complete